MGQKLLQQAPEKRYALYLSTGYIYPEFRRSSGSLEDRMLRLNFYHMHWDLSECIIYFATTFSHFEKSGSLVHILSVSRIISSRPSL